MHQYSALVFIFTMLISYFDLSQTMVNTNENYAQQYHEAHLDILSGIFNNNTNIANIESRKNCFHLPNYKTIFHKISKKSLQNTVISPRPNLETQSTYYSPGIYTRMDYSNVAIIDNKHTPQQTVPLYNLRYKLLEDNYDPQQHDKSMLLKQLQSQKQELSEGYTNFINDPYQQKITPKETTMSSNDYFKTQFLAEYVTPSPANLEMHPNLHHHSPQIIYKKPAIVSHATGNEPSPMTATSIKPLTSIKSMQQFLIANNNEKYFITNKYNNFDNNAKPLTNVNKPVLKFGSKQYFYAPMRPAVEKELPSSTNTLPYPPSFISITTTDKPLTSYKSINNKIPDLFSHRQFKSLWDSYIPSWQITTMLQQFKHKTDSSNNNINLKTLAFSRKTNNEIKK